MKNAGLLLLLLLQLCKAQYLDKKGLPDTLYYGCDNFIYVGILKQDSEKEYHFTVEGGDIVPTSEEEDSLIILPSKNLVLLKCYEKSGEDSMKLTFKKNFIIDTVPRPILEVKANRKRAMGKIRRDDILTVVIKTAPAFPRNIVRYYYYEIEKCSVLHRKGLGGARLVKEYGRNSSYTIDLSTIDELAKGEEIILRLEMVYLVSSNSGKKLGVPLLSKERMFSFQVK